MTYFLCCSDYEVPFQDLAEAHERLLDIASEGMPCGEHWIEDGSGDVTITVVVQ